jgi:hypothetical protein
MSWIRSILSIIPLKPVLEWVLERLKDLVSDSSNTIDDAAVAVIEAILRETGVLDKKS